MQEINYDFVVIGGDLRQVSLAAVLISRGYQVCGYAFCDTEKPIPCPLAPSLREAVTRSRIILAPIPISKAGKGFNHQSSVTDLSLSGLMDILQEGQSLFAGCIPDDFKAAAAAKGVSLFDLMAFRELAIFNTIATAEGAIAEAICKSSRNLHHSRCLILGYGKCAKALAGSLGGLGARVTVCARDSSARAEAAIWADDAVDFPALESLLPKYDFIFNTIPTRVLERRHLTKLQKHAVIIDIASAPGGVDFTAAREMDLSAWLCPGLPGKYAPDSSAEAIADTVLNHVSST